MRASGGMSDTAGQPIGPHLETTAREFTTVVRCEEVNGEEATQDPQRPCDVGGLCNVATPSTDESRFFFRIFFKNEE